MSAKTSQQAIEELSFYSLGHYDTAYFIHQHVVDAYKAQTLDDNTSLVGVIFSLVGLYLFLEKGYTGKRVQLAHMEMAKKKRKERWPKIKLPEDRGMIKVQDVVEVAPGKERDQMIKTWCISVWSAYRDNHEAIATLVREEWGLT